MRSLGPVMLLAFLVVGLCGACAAEPVIQTVEVPVTVEVVRTVLVTARPADTPTPAATQPPAVPVAAPTVALPTVVTPTATPADPSPELQSYLAIARVQCTEIFGCLSDLSVFADAPHIQSQNEAAYYTGKLTMASGRVAAVRNMLNTTSPPAELAEAHHLMLSACGYIDGALQKAYTGDDAQEPLDRGYEDSVAAERLLKAAAGAE